MDVNIPVEVNLLAFASDSDSCEAPVPEALTPAVSKIIDSLPSAQFIDNLLTGTPFFPEVLETLTSIALSAESTTSN